MKEFISQELSRNNGIKLAHRIYHDGFIPDVIYVSLRGGAYLGNLISEYFKCIRTAERPVFYAAVVAHSYSGIHSREAVRIDGWTYDPEHLRHGDKVLIVDDIFDSGHTLNHLKNIIVATGVQLQDIRIAVHDYKIRIFESHSMPVKPDYYCRKIEIHKPEEDKWVHYLTHELAGLSQQEIDKFYSVDLEVHKILTSMSL